MATWPQTQSSFLVDTAHALPCGLAPSGQPGCTCLWHLWSCLLWCRAPQQSEIEKIQLGCQSLTQHLVVSQRRGEYKRNASPGDRLDQSRGRTTARACMRAYVCVVYIVCVVYMVCVRGVYGVCMVYVVCICGKCVCAVSVFMCVFMCVRRGCYSITLCFISLRQGLIL